MEKYTYDYIHNTNTYLYQHPSLFRINTDTALLANFMKIQKNDRVCDIGTNNGALLLHARQFSPKTLIGVEVQEEALKVASFNKEHFKVENMELYSKDVREMDLKDLDVVVCNPPYFNYGKDANVNASKELHMARHEEFLPFEDLCKKVSSFLKDNGRFYLVHRADRSINLLTLLHKYGLEPKHIRYAYGKGKDTAHAILIEAIKGANEGVIIEKVDIV